jgi:hypothetical protein
MMLRCLGLAVLLLTLLGAAGCSVGDSPEYTPGYGWSNMPSDFRTRPYRPMESKQ